MKRIGYGVLLSITILLALAAISTVIPAANASEELGWSGYAIDPM